jgi:MFS family permease
MNGPATGGIPVSAKRRGYTLTAGVLLVMMLGGTLPVPLYVLWEKQMGFGPLGVTVVFAAYVAGTLAALLVLGDLSDHVGRRIVLAIAVACAAVSTDVLMAVGHIPRSGGFVVGGRSGPGASPSELIHDRGAERRRLRQAPRPVSCAASTVRLSSPVRAEQRV